MNLAFVSQSLEFYLEKHRGLPTSDQKYSPEVWDKRERGRREVMKKESGKSLSMRP